MTTTTATITTTNEHYYYDDNDANYLSVVRRSLDFMKMFFLDERCYFLSVLSTLCYTLIKEILSTRFRISFGIL